jgi:hypothetical protein
MKEASGTQVVKISRGFGDTVHKIAKAVGADKIADAFSQATGKDCGCSKRKEALNKILPY